MEDVTNIEHFCSYPCSSLIYVLKALLLIVFTYHTRIMQEIQELPYLLCGTGGYK